MAEMDGKTAQEWFEARVRDAARKTAANLRRVADDIERAADNSDLDRLPYRVIHTLSWGVANAHPEDAAMQYAEYAKAERGGYFTDKPAEQTTDKKD